jgi:hypothetical protein
LSKTIWKCVIKEEEQEIINLENKEIVSVEMVKVQRRVIVQEIIIM